MPKKFFKRYLPDPHTMRTHKRFQFFGRLLHDPNLWHLNRHSLSGGLAVGLFVAFIPLPTQMVIAAAAAILLRVNFPLSVATVWITNPLTMPPMFWFAYKVGVLILGTATGHPPFEPTLDWFWQELDTIWQPFFLGCFICGSVSALAGYGVIQLLWRLRVRRHLKQRRAKRERRQHERIGPVSRNSNDRRQS